MTEKDPKQENYSEGVESGPRRLYRSVADRKIAGVCGGIAEYFGIDALIVRIVWVFSVFFGFFGFFAYLVAWIVVPDNPKGVDAGTRPPSTSGRYVWGTVLILLGVIFLAEQNDFHWLVPWHWSDYMPRWFSWGMMFSVLLILLGVFLVLRGTNSADLSSQTNTPEAESITNFSTTGEFQMGQKRLIRSFQNRMIGGVCGGLAEYFNVDPSLVRVAWVLITFFSGFFFGIIAYIVLMVVVPEEQLDINGSGSTEHQSSKA